MLRYKVYVEDTGFISREKLSPKQNELKQEWDTFDIKGLDMNSEILSLEQLKDNIMTIIVMANGRCIGGLRIIDNDIPMKESYAGFDRLIRSGIYPREISRLIVDRKFRKDKNILIRLLRYGYRTSANRNDLLCKSKKDMINFYERMGFLLLDNKPLIDYKLNGDWYALHLDIYQRFVKKYMTNKSEKKFINLITKPLDNKNLLNKIKECYNIAVLIFTPKFKRNNVRLL